jgi:RNA recognition motif-containing protein
MEKGKEVVNKMKSKEGKTYNELMEEQMALLEPKEEPKAEEPKEEKKEGEGEVKKEAYGPGAAAMLENQRLYVMNLSYQVTHDELKEHFGSYGDIDNIEIPLRKGGGGAALGIAYISFKETEGAISAYASMDKTYY